MRDGGILNSELTAIVNLPLPPLLVPVPSVPHPYLGIAERITNVIVGDPVAIDAWAERGGGKREGCISNTVVREMPGGLERERGKEESGKGGKARYT